MAKSPLTTAERLERDKRKLAALQAQISRREKALAATNRKLDTRRKVLLGAFVLERIQTQPDHPVSSALKSQISEFREYLSARNEPLFSDIFASTKVAAE
jgi:hypothetical protein